MRTTIMTNERARLTHRLTHGRLLLVAAGLMLAATAIPRTLAAETEEGDLKSCVDGEWADYNACLMESGMEWEKRLCDYYFEAGTVLCFAKYRGEIRRAASGTTTTSA